MRISAYAAFCLFTAFLPARSQSLNDIDNYLGLQRHQAIASTSSFVMEGEDIENLRMIFQNMTGTGTVQSFSGPAGQTLFLSADPTVNAFASGGGRLYVTTGLYRALAGNRGLLAFVMGHELVHNLAQHGAKRYLREVNFQQGYRNLYIQNGPLAANVYAATTRVLLNKLERDEEHEADQAGLRIAAEAGYHPDFAILAARVMRAEVGELGKFGAFFSTHPRWTTREERSERNYEEALAIFEARWPDVEKSPGGRPPAVASVSPLSVNKSADKILVTATARIRNLDVPATVTVRLVGERVAEPIEIGSRTFLPSTSGSESLSFQVDRSLLKGRKGKQFATLVVRCGTLDLFEAKPVKLN